jgi:hypothetical protein
LKTRIPSHYRERARLDQNLDKLKKTVNLSLINLQNTWNDGKSVSMRDKIAFCSATGNIFVTALLLGMAPEKLPIWYTGQMAYYMPLRYFSYHRLGYHYFIADLCYWVNLMVFPLRPFLMPACTISLGVSLFGFSLDSNVLFGIWLSSMGHHRLAKLPRLP